MKAVLFLCAAGALAVAPPRIELNLPQTPSYSLQKLKLSKVGSHSLGYKQPNGASVGSRQDWTQRCPAGSMTTAVNCPVPEALAFDHNDRSIQVTQTVKRVDLNNAGGAAVTVSSIDYTKRSTYLVYFDAQDAAGNHAEQVVFAIILDDTSKPVIRQCKSAKTYVEAATAQWKNLCWTDTAFDNYDHDVTSSIYYRIQRVDNGGTFLECGGKSQCKKYEVEGLINGMTVGEYVVSVYAHDNAGAYGHQFADNLVIATRVVVVRDTTSPVIQVLGQNPYDWQECGSQYNDDGAKSTDSFEGAISVTSTGTVNVGRVDSYEIVYSSQDGAVDPEDADAPKPNSAESKSRTVIVRDTTKPVVSLLANNEGDTSVIEVHSSKNNRFVEKVTDPGIKCVDACDKSCERGQGYMPGERGGRQCSVSTKWDRDFDDSVVGTYTRTYSCTDKSGNTGDVTRTFKVIDSDAPTVHLVGLSEITVEASRQDVYADQGARCEDFHHNSLVPAMGGDKVNLKVTGDYVVSYTCKDPKGEHSAESATTEYRTVRVRDTTCPQVTLKGEAFVYIEAGFEYNDLGASAYDSFDGPISNIIVDGNTVNDRNAFYSRSSCAEIYKAYDDAEPGAVAPAGEYFITRFWGPEGKKTLQRTKVWCDMNNGGYTYKAINDGKVAINMANPHSEGDCKKYGMTVALFGGKKALKDAAVAHFCPATPGLRGANAPKCKYTLTTKSTYYLCELIDNAEHVVDKISKKVRSSAPTHEVPHNKISRAEQGKYIISYRANDKAGNAQCKVAKRTVVVKDTLPPVITLRWANKGIVHKSANNQRGIGNVVNDPTENIPANVFTKDARFDKTGLGDAKY